MVSPVYLWKLFSIPGTFVFALDGYFVLIYLDYS